MKQNGPLAPLEAHQKRIHKLLTDYNILIITKVHYGKEMKTNFVALCEKYLRGILFYYYVYIIEHLGIQTHFTVRHVFSQWDSFENPYEMLLKKLNMSCVNYKNSSAFLTYLPIVFKFQLQQIIWK